MFYLMRKRFLDRLMDRGRSARGGGDVARVVQHAPARRAPGGYGTVSTCRRGLWIRELHFAVESMNEAQRKIVRFYEELPDSDYSLEQERNELQREFVKLLFNQRELD